MARLLAIVLITLASFAEAAEFKPSSVEECSTVRLDQGPRFSGVPRFDMGGGSICGAPTTATLIETLPPRNKLAKVPISPWFLAVKWAAANSDGTNLRADRALFVAEQARTLPACPYEVVPDISQGRYFMDFASALLDGARSKDIRLMRRAVVDYFGEAGSARVGDNMFRFPPATKVEIVDSVLSAVCAGQTFTMPGLPKLESLVANEPQYRDNLREAWTLMRKVVNRNLATGIPTGVNYCQKVLADPNVNGVGPHGGWSEVCTRGPGDYMGHAGVIVGRRVLRHQAGKVCQYLIRDTFGKRCPDPREDCENGQVWVDEDALFYNTRDIYYFATPTR